MSAFAHTMTDILTDEEWNELQALREAISYNPATVHPLKMEKFTELFSRSLRGKGHCEMSLEPSNY